MTFVTFFRSLFVGAALIAASPAVVAGQKADIIDTAKSAGNFTTLVAAIEAAGLTDTLKGKGPFTVFAPTDEAFAKLPAGTVEALLKDQEKLAKILTYHVVAGEVTAKQVKPGKVTTVEGSTLNVTRGSQGVKVDNANVVAVDVMATNGVIHVIDSVVMPN
jgi:uncharacterized surface protein with fasciclin (FAS1) repeats